MLQISDIGDLRPLMNHIYPECNLKIMNKITNNICSEVFKIKRYEDI